MTTDDLLVIGLILAVISGYCVGMLHASQKILFWQLEWIKVEHRLAAIQLREPRTCSEIEINQRPYRNNNQT